MESCFLIFSLVSIDANDILIAGFDTFIYSSLVLLTFTQIRADSKVTIFHIFSWTFMYTLHCGLTVHSACQLPVARWQSCDLPVLR